MPGGTSSICGAMATVVERSLRETLDGEPATTIGLHVFF
jgi:hypothetical protein